VILLDTDILVHAAGAQSLRHAKAKELRDQAVTGEFEGCMAAQVLTEFYAVGNRSSAVSAAANAKPGPKRNSSLPLFSP
jgi:predicted nucleic acid-binding protein